MNEIQQGFKACLFHPNLGNEVVEGRICIDPRGVQFESGAIAEAIPADRVVLELETGGDRIYFTDPERPELKIFTVDQSILGHGSFARCSGLREQLSAILTRRELWRRLRITGFFFLGCLVLAWVGSWTVGVMVRSLAAGVPVAWERQFGDKQVKMLRKEGSLVDDSNQVAQLTALAAPLMRVVPLGKTEIQFHIVDDPTPNAFALPGGQVLVNTGLLRMVDQPEELLGVLAHELAHVTQRHLARKVISASGPVLIFGVFLHSGDGVLNMLSEGAGLMVYQGFSQEYETEADDVGWRYLVAAKIDPQGMISIFRKFKAYEAKEKLAAALPQAFQSHPALDTRIRRLEARWRKLQGKSEFITLTNPIPTPNPGTEDPRRR